MSKYTSDLLCHFVGRSQKTDDERFDLLSLIIREGRLRANVKDPDSLAILYSNKLHAGEVFERCDCVCFCDIPDDALGIHANKYSKFGLGFKKSFVAEQGAHPVMYVPENYQIFLRGDESRTYNPKLLPRDANGYFLRLSNLSCNFIALAEMLLPLLDRNELEEKTVSKDIRVPISREVWELFMSNKEGELGTDVLCGIVHLLSFVKLYNAALPEDHPDNYYMEREWRCLNNVQFSIDDICNVYLPNKEYKARFCAQFPTYHGEYRLLDE